MVNSAGRRYDEKTFLLQRNIILCLYDYSGLMAQPWVEAGYRAILVDIQHPAGMSEYGPWIKIGADLRHGWDIPENYRDRIAFVAAFSPCDHLAVSGARWFRGKGLRALEWSIALFATAVDICETANAPYMIENPVSTISTYWRKPDYTFSPHEFNGLEPSDNYTKKTCLWVGNGFVMPQRFPDMLLPPPDDRIHRVPQSENRKNARSITPLGFARAVFTANAPKIREPYEEKFVTKTKAETAVSVASRFGKPDRNSFYI